MVRWALVQTENSATEIRECAVGYPGKDVRGIKTAQKSSGDLLLLFNCSMYIYEWVDSFLFDLRVSHSQVYKEVPSCIDSVHKKITIYLSILKQSTFYLPSSLVLLSRFSRVRLCATPETAAHHAPPSLGFSRQEHWSELPFPSPMQESEKWKWNYSIVSNSSRPHGL